MHRPNALSTLIAVTLLGTLVLAPAGCSSDSSNPNISSPAAAPDGYPPAMPSGLEVAKWGETGLKLMWDANTEADLAGYRLYVYDPSPFRDDAYCCHTGLDLIEATHYLYTEPLAVGNNYFKLAAVDHDGNESMLLGPYAYSWNGGAVSPERSEQRQGTPDTLPYLPGDAPLPPTHGDEPQDGDDWDPEQDW